jgi:ParB-like chromosome segregation protein Spo0J
LDICYRAVGELSLSSRNARTHSAEQIKQVANSIAQFGFINPIVIDTHNSIVAGHARLKAAKRLGIPTLGTDKLSSLQAAYRDEEHL